MVQLVQGIVDTQKNICRSIGRANAGDDLELELEVKMNEQPITFVNPICELLMKKSDNNKVRQTNGILYQDGKFKIKVDEQGVTCPGTVINQLIINDEGKISTCLFYFTVGASLEKEILQSISKVETLEQLDSYVVAAFSNLDEYEKRLTLLDSTMKTTNEEITINESERKANESERKANESERIENEKERVKKESERSEAEIDRKSSELDRAKNENARRIAENTRIARENARENAEINRNAIFEENETIRNEAEKLREKAEIKRKENFNNLETLNEKLNEAEKERKEAEEDRRTKETERQLAEAERERAEANREKTYTSFNDAEVDRKNSEDARIQAEASRVQAENERSEQFEAAQSARETKFQESENNRDKLFKANETARATEEIARKQAESTREGNEAIRVNDESLRVASEKARQQEEIKRGQAEVARVEAEKVREISYEAIKKDNSTFKQQMNEDFGNAKADYFGKEHNNIVDRLNSDFDNVHQRINDSNYLEYSGSNIKADNSYYGYTKEISVKGRTLQNLYPKLDINNYFKKSTMIKFDENVIKFTADGTYQDFWLKKEALNVKPNTTYTLVIDVLKNTIVNTQSDEMLHLLNTTNLFTNQMSFFKNEVALNKNTAVGRYKFKVITKDNLSVAAFATRCYLSAEAISGELWVKYSLLEGDYTNIDFDIPYFAGIKSVGESYVTEEGKYPVNIKSCGKNLFDGQLQRGYWYNDTLKSSDYAVANINNIPIKTNTCYSFYIEGYNGNIYIEELNNNLQGIKSFAIKSGQFINTTNGRFLRFCTANNESEKVEIHVKVQIEEGTVATDYEPYQESIQELLLDEPLRSLPNGVCDEIKDGVLIRRCEEIILNGSESGWVTQRTKNDGSFGYAINLKYRAKNYQNQILHMTGLYLKPANQYSVWETDANTIYLDSDVHIYTDGGSLDQFKTTLSKNPIKVIYELATPVEIPLTNYNINLKTYAGTTHIASTNVLPATINCKVPSNVQAVISNLKEENKALNTQVSTLNLENEEIKETNIIQDELIDTTMMATDEMYMMLEPLLAETLSERSTSKMVDMYVAMVQRGIKTIEQVPIRYREQVKKILDQLEK